MHEINIKMRLKKTRIDVKRQVQGARGPVRLLFIDMAEVCGERARYKARRGKEQGGAKNSPYLPELPFAALERSLIRHTTGRRCDDDHTDILRGQG